MRVDIEFTEFFSYQERWLKYEELLRELLIYQSTPYEITHACMVAEEGGGYMRDYIGDDNGKLIQISFDKIRE